MQAETFVKVLGADFYMLLCYENLSGKMEQGLIPPKERLIEQPEPPFGPFAAAVAVG